MVLQKLNLMLIYNKKYNLNPINQIGVKFYHSVIITVFTMTIKIKLFSNIINKKKFNTQHTNDFMNT